MSARLVRCSYGAPAVDVLRREDDGSLAILDYKTDAMQADAVASRVAYYKPQMDAYRRAVKARPAQP